jgi:NTP pyrophosphatase (non-canonical NTP hydrolase)
MNDAEYTAGVFSVKSGSYAPDNADPVNFVDKLKTFINAAKELDKAKKALFYPGAPAFGFGGDPKDLFMFKVFEELGHVDTLHAILGLITESGELAERLLLLEKMNWDNNEEVAEAYRNLKEEYGDIFWYLYLGVADIGETPAEIREANMRKLRTRYPDKFSGPSALRRNVDAELRALSSDPKDRQGG